MTVAQTKSQRRKILKRYGARKTYSTVAESIERERISAARQARAKGKKK